ncbi:MAG: SMI1/KNR4 family protein [Clostridia bacterium]|nr:SMI1/KNR4 family protein [Clostridia bacterium]
MNFSDFYRITEDIKSKHPIWFELNSRNVPTDSDIKLVESNLNIILNDDYKNFVKRYNGGYFAFTKILTVCSEDELYLLNFNSSEFVEKYKFVTVGDMETGDMVGFKVVNGLCGSEVFVFNHEKKTVENSNIGNFFDYILKYGYNL